MLEYWKGHYYTEIFSELFAVIALIVSLKARKQKGYKLFPLYFTGYLFTKISPVIHVTCYLETDKDAFLRALTYYVDYIFTVFEFIVFFSFIRLQLQSVNLLFKILPAIFLTFSTVALFTDLLIYKTLQKDTLIYLYTLQEVCLLLCAIVYFQIILSGESGPVPKYNSSVFWIVTGIMVFMLSILPYSIALSIFKSHQVYFINYMFAIFHVFYVVLFSMTIKGFLCVPAPRK